ncbi:MAG: NlpC/P60 family protein [Syntrophomonadaceae bacterium]|nr:NlpC/P60 family protein [Syntrophomonadaceae bacterium]MDD3888322.1 NlpC/P60 family protein [Syntrophomonadaceae bacterium]MDD4548829.1 NlpC/P60 family protein [Syntrophomonadaceae bacterium]
MKKLLGIFLATFMILTFYSTSTLASDNYYTVQTGDTLWAIASNNGMSIDYLMSVNKLQSENLKPGVKLLIKNSEGTEQPVKKSNSEVEQPVQTDDTETTQVYCIQEGDTLFKIAHQLGTTVERLKYVNNMSSDIIYVGNSLIVPTGNANVSRAGLPTSGNRIIAKAEEYLGTPYRYGGQGPGGFDCSGFAKYIYKQFGYDLPRTAASQFQNGTTVAREDMVPGDLVFFSCGRGGIDHVGIYSGSNRFIHSSSPRSGGVIYSSLTEGYYAKCFVGAKRCLR